MPENSRAAFHAAIAAGLGIECDVQLTADNEVAVFHDFTLDRLTGASGPVHARTAGELAKLEILPACSDPDASRGSDVGWTGRGGRAIEPRITETIPMLSDLLSLVAGQVPLLIEVKTDADTGHTQLCSAVATALAPYQGPFAVMSFSSRVLSWLARHAPATPRGLVLSRADYGGRFSDLRCAAALRTAKADFLAVDIHDLPDAFMVRARARGLGLASWTVRTPAQLATARCHADAPIAEGAAAQLLGQ